MNWTCKSFSNDIKQQQGLDLGCRGFTVLPVLLVGCLLHLYFKGLTVTKRCFAFKKTPGENSKQLVEFFLPSEDFLVYWNPWSRFDLGNSSMSRDKLVRKNFFLEMPRKLAVIFIAKWLIEQFRFYILRSVSAVVICAAFLTVQDTLKSEAKTHIEVCQCPNVCLSRHAVKPTGHSIHNSDQRAQVFGAQNTSNCRPFNYLVLQMKTNGNHLEYSRKFFLRIFGQRSYRLSPLQGIRIGEAQNPGPDINTFEVTLINPTALWSKMDCIAEFESQLLCFAETSTTAIVQNKLTPSFRKLGFSTIWGTSSPKQIQKYTDDSHRGAAVGVSNHCKFPIRQSCTDSLSDWEKAGRYMHTYVKLPHVEIQVITVYGFHSNLPAARQRTDQLLHFALEQMALTTHPVILCGDLNHHPSKLDAAKILKEKGFRTSEELFIEIEGGEMPFTYGDSSKNDVIFLSPWLASQVIGVRVDDRKLFAGHNPVSVQIQLPTTQVTSQTWRMPNSWIALEPDPQLLAANYSQDPIIFPADESDTPDSLFTQWAVQVEKAVDKTIRAQHQMQPEKFPVARLSRSYRGRNVPRKLIQTPFPRTIKQAWNGHYNPPTDGMTIGFRQRTKQLRRIQSLLHLIRKYHPQELTGSQESQIHQEWNAILASTGFVTGFPGWVEQIPELNPVTENVPMPEELDIMCQFLKYQLDTEASLINQKNKRHAKYLHQQDLKKYHMQATFKSIREPTPGLIRQVQTEKCFHAMHYQTDGSGLMTLTMQEDAIFDTRQDLTIDGHTASFIDWNTPHLDVMIHNPTAVLSDKPKVCQVNPTVEPAEVAGELSKYWEKYWNATTTSERQEDEEWSKFQRFLSEVPQMQQIEIDVNSIALWKDAILSIRSKTATGVCGWTADEIKGLPDNILLDLIELFRRFTKDGFPQWFMQARVIPLAKKPQATDPKFSRPITIFSLLYRIWSRVVTRQILQKWTDTFPASITGFLPGRSPGKLLYELQFRLETICQGKSSQQFGGVTLDLVKAFNLLPRIPCYRALLQLGIPEPILNQWYKSITKMQRLWQVEMQLFPSRMPWVGFPEGDTWSIICMLAICRVWDYHLSLHQIDNNTFADNWSWFTEDPSKHADATSITVELIDSLDMLIDWDKTWCWATSDLHKNALKQVKMDFLPENTKFTQINSSKELGHIMHYKCTPYREPHKVRHRQTIARLRKIKKLTATIDEKAKIVKAACFPKALYGAERYFTGQRFVDQLRTETAKALLGEYNNLNGYIATMCLSKFVEDPELYLIKKAVIEARAFLTFATTELQKQFYNVVATYSGHFAHAVGPASALNLYLAKLDWQCDKAGFLHIDGFYKLHLVDTNVDTLVNALETSWMEHISQVVTRQGFRNMPVVNRSKTIQVFGKVPETHQKCIALEMVGCHMIARQKSHFVENQTDKCDLCGQIETRRHNLLECEATQTVREHYKHVCDRLDELDPIHILAPFVFQHPQINMHRLIHHTMPEGETHWPCNSPTTYFFSDGSCHQPQCADTRWAAYSLVTPTIPVAEIIALPNLPIETILEKYFAVIVVSHVPGMQSIPRAELYAALKFFEGNQPDHTLYTDSAYVISSVNLVWQTDDVRNLHHKKNFDLLKKLHLAVHRFGNPPKIDKVQSHQDLNVAGFQRFLRIGNAVADEAAKKVAVETGLPLTQEKRTIHLEMLESVRQLSMEYEMRYELARARVAHQKKQPQENPPENIQKTGLQRLKEWTIPNPMLYPISNDHQIAAEASRWGVAYTSLIYTWLASLYWPQNEITDDGVGITWYELAINFWLTTQQAPLINLAKGNQPPDIVNIVEHPAYDASHYTFAKMIFAFAGSVEHAAYVYGSAILPLRKRVKAKSLFQLGANVFRQGLPVRPVMQLQVETMDIIDRYIQQHTNGNNIQFHEYPDIPTRTPLFASRYADIDGDNFQRWQSRYTKRKKQLKTLARHDEQ